jgi:hypothetical protein
MFYCCRKTNSLWILIYESGVPKTSFLYYIHLISTGEQPIFTTIILFYFLFFFMLILIGIPLKCILNTLTNPLHNSFDKITALYDHFFFYYYYFFLSNHKQCTVYVLGTLKCPAYSLWAGKVLKRSRRLQITVFSKKSSVLKKKKGTQ